jgi:hypothetical protein
MENKPTRVGRRAAQLLGRFVMSDRPLPGIVRLLVLIALVIAALRVGPSPAVVINSNVQAGTLAQGYGLPPAPTVTSVSPSSGSTAGGTSVTITGTGFSLAATSFGAGSFGAATNIAAGLGPRSIAIGDLNGDGKPDLAVVNSSSNNVSVLLGTGTGSFGAGTNFAVGTNPRSVATGDLNGDGKADLAVANTLSNSVSVLLGTGTGTGAFGTATSFAVGTNPRSVAVGDLNGDGKPDLAVANSGDGSTVLLGTVSVLLGAGTGAFGAATNFAVGTGTGSVAIGDLNGDGKPDLVVTAHISTGNSNDFRILTSHMVSVLLGTGTGSFGAATNFGLEFGASSVAIGDLNGDGKPDLAVTSKGSDNKGVPFNNVLILLGTGTGSFGAATSFAVGLGPFSVTIGDLNGDGKPDLATANLNDNAGNNVSILLGTGTGAFGGATNFTVGTGPASVAIGDLNGDGKPDLAVANFSSNNVTVLLGTGVGFVGAATSFGAATNFAVGTNPESVATGDLNGDGKPDLAVANRDNNNVSILLGAGAGSFGAATNFAVGTRPVFVTVGDLNGDGKLDLAVANESSNNVSVLLGAGSGSFGAATSFTVGTNPRSVAIGDLNGDGKPDLAVANVESNNVSILLGTGTGSFGAATNFAAGSGSFSVAIGDLNGDGKPDLAVANVSSSNVSILLGTGTGSFGAATNFAAGTSPRSVAIGDLNGDGKPDLATANKLSDDVSVLLGTGSGSFSAAANLTAGTGPHSVAIGDLNGDGKPDLAVAHLVSNNVSVLLGTGTGSFGAATNFAVGTNPISLAIEDLSGDGKPDLAVANVGTNNVSVLLGTGTVSGATVALGGTAATNVTVVNASTITAITPARAAGAVNVVVTNPDNQSGTLSNGFTFVAPPTVTTVSPSSESTAGGTSVTITGAGFVNGATVTFGGTAATNVTVVGATTITATTPAHAAGAVNVVVTNPDNQSGTLSNGFTFVAAPTVTSVNPASGFTAGGTSVTITGAGFVSGATVAFGGTAAINVTVVSTTTITATTPAHAAGAVSVVVTNPDGQMGTLSNGFTFVVFVSTTFTQTSVSLPAIGSQATITLQAQGVDAGADGVQLNIQHTSAVTVTGPACVGIFSGATVVAPAATTGGTLIGCQFLTQGQNVSATTGNVMTFVLTRVGTANPILSLLTGGAFGTQFSDGGSAIGPGQTNTLQVLQGVTVSGTVTIQGRTATFPEGVGHSIATVTMSPGNITANVAADGTFQFSSAVAETVTFTASAPGYLSAQRADVQVGSSAVALPSVQLRAGLVNSDTAVNIQDISAVVASFGTSPQARIDAQGRFVDQNGDGGVSILDISAVVSSFGLSSPTSWP